MKYKTFDELIKASEKKISHMDKTELKNWNEMSDIEKNTNYLVDFRPQLQLPIKNQCATITIALETGITEVLRGNIDDGLECIGEKLKIR